MRGNCLNENEQFKFIIGHDWKKAKQEMFFRHSEIHYTVVSKLPTLTKVVSYGIWPVRASDTEEKSCVHPTTQRQATGGFHSSCASTVTWGMHLPIGRLPRWLSDKESTFQCRQCTRCRFKLWVGKIPRSRIWQSLQFLFFLFFGFFCLENPMDRGVWWLTDWSNKEWDNLVTEHKDNTRTTGNRLF